MLIAAGGFAIYRKETHVYSLAAAVGPLNTARAKVRFLDSFLAGYLGTFPGLNVRPLAERAVSEVDSVEQFLPRFMSGLAHAQRAEQWVEATPAHALRIREIERVVPRGAPVHVIRDGRDCALSLAGQPWRPRAPWQRTGTLPIAALYSEWIMRAGQAAGRDHPTRYLEIRFEDLIQRTAATLSRLGRFLDHDLDFGRIRRNGVHALLNPNSTFKEERGPAFNPVGRSRRPCWAPPITACEQAVGPYLQQLGYELGYPEAAARTSVRWRATRAAI
jgi:hypothetical protein